MFAVRSQNGPDRFVNGLANPAQQLRTNGGAGRTTATARSERAIKKERVGRIMVPGGEESLLGRDQGVP
jgi:hypothetical protein